MAWAYDSHIHLSDPEYVSEIHHIFKTMESVKIKACCVSMGTENSQQTLDLAKKSKHVLPFIGIHPEYAGDDLELMKNMIRDNNQTISGIGEIGLDPTFVRPWNSHERQVEVFEALLGLAEKYQKPVSIHSRKSLDEIFEIMTSYTTKHALLHWFDGSKKQLKTAMDMGFFVSYGPVMVYANDKQVLIAKTDPSKILVETDGPVRFSRCFEMKSAQVSFIPSVIFCASKILNRSYEDMVLLLEENSKVYLGRSC